MNVAGFYEESITNGPGWRSVLFVSGCVHKCKGCHNPETWDKNYGISFKPEYYLQKIKESEITRGVTISGGEPFLYPDELIPFLKEVKKLGKDVWVYTGYKYEELLKDFKKKEMLKYIDVLVDGLYVEEKRDLNLRFRGSSNQRIIDVKKTLEDEDIILWDPNY